MYVIIAPARNCAPAAHPEIGPEAPSFLDKAKELACAVRAYAPHELESILQVNPTRAMELYFQYQGFGQGDAGSPALLSYYGAAYRNMHPEDFSLEDWAFAQQRLRILSALYGILCPKDGIEPHRLGLDFRYQGQDLYTFWGDLLARSLTESKAMLINLASNDYAKLILPHYLSDQVLTCRFLQHKEGRIRGTVSTVRTARGLMTRYIVKNRIEHPLELQGFDAAGYRYYPHLSDERTYVFVSS